MTQTSLPVLEEAFADTSRMSFERLTADGFREWPYFEANPDGFHSIRFPAIERAVIVPKDQIFGGLHDPRRNERKSCRFTGKETL